MEVKVVTECGEVLGLATVFPRVDILHACGAGAVGAPELPAWGFGVRPEVEVVPEGATVT